MKKYLWKRIIALLCSLSLIIIGLPQQISIKANASDYYFRFNTVKVMDQQTVELQGATEDIWVTNEAGLPNTTDVKWTVKGDKDVVKLSIPDSTKPNMARLERLGPGYADITAEFKDNNVTYMIQCKVKVDFTIDMSSTDYVSTDNVKDTKVMLFTDTEAAAKTVVLKYVNNSAIANDNASLSWISSNENIVKVNGGVIIPQGSGKATITIRTNTVSAGEVQTPLIKTFTVVVGPKARYPVGSGSYKRSLEVTLQGTTVVQTNSLNSNNLVWRFYDKTGKNQINAQGIITYTLDANSGNITFLNAKAGTYYVRAFAAEDYIPSSFDGGPESSAVPYLEMKLTAPVSSLPPYLVMNVKDTFSIAANSNISNVNDYTIISGDTNIISVSNGILTAVNRGEALITLTRKTDSSEVYTINVTVVDAIALNVSTANIYTAGTLQLVPIVTNNNYEVTWKSDNTAVATVDSSGLVTGVSAGDAIITASQTINGVVKTATCKIYVQQSVTNITITPSEVTLDIGESKTIRATITPANLQNITLKWVSSNSTVVTVSENNGTVANLLAGSAPGTAVVTAINQENVVVGFCKVTVKQKVSSITLSATSLSLMLSAKTYQLRATVLPGTATNTAVTWSSTNPSVATVNETGLVTLVASGSTSIIVTSADDPTKTAVCNLTIGISAVGIKLDEASRVMYTGDTGKLSYTITPANATNMEVIWSSTDPNIVSVDSKGNLSAKTAGVAVIILKTSDGLYMSTCTITVKQKATNLEFDVTNLELYIGKTYTIKVTPTPVTATDYTLKWASLDATIASVDDNGTITAKAAGKTMITATTSTGSILYCNVTVKAEATGLQLNYSEKTVVIGDYFDLKGTIKPSAAADEVTLLWTSSKTSVATVSTSGRVKGIKGGTAVITCKTSDGKFTAFCTVTVVEKVTSVTLNKTSYTLGLGKTYTLVAKVKTNAASNPTIKWTTSNAKIATVDQKGKVTGKALGTVTITAATTDGSGEKATAQIRVVKAVTSVTLNRTAVTTIVGKSFTLTATVRPSNATYKTVTWKSSDEKVAIVDSYGKVTALKEGTVTIKASAKDSSGKYAISYIIVQPRVPSNSVTILNQNLTMVVGETAVLQKAMNPSTSTDSAKWASDNKTVATVTTSGTLTAKRPGIANITVMTESGKTATTKVTVVGLNTTNLVLEQYTDYTLFVLGITSGVTWDVTDSEIAVVTGGKVSTRRVGTTTITATVNGRRLTCKLKVTKIK